MYWKYGACVYKFYFVCAVVVFIGNMVWVSTIFSLCVVVVYGDYFVVLTSIDACVVVACMAICVCMCSSLCNVVVCMLTMMFGVFVLLHEMVVYYSEILILRN